MKKWILKHKWVSLSVLVIVAGLAIIALFTWDQLKGDVVTRVVAVCGLLCALGKAGYDVWDKERERRKKDEEKKERVKVIVECKPYLVHQNWLGLTIYNDGPKVNIRRVVLCATKEGKTEEHDLYIRESLNRTVWQTRYELEPKATVEYCWREHPSKLPEEADFRIVIESFQGQLAVVPHDEIERVVKEELARKGG